MRKGNFIFTETVIKGVFIIEQKVFVDNRGYFFESYHKEIFSQVLTNEEFVQDNYSKSSKGVLRGLHFQTKNVQGKLVRVVKGEVFDVAVDLRKGSNSYGKWFGIVLSDTNKYQLYIPRGFAHGFLVLSDVAEFAYKCTDFYNPNAQDGLHWNDPSINIDWPLDKIDKVILSDKDIRLKTLKEYKVEL